MKTPSLRRSFVLANAGPLTPAQRRAMFAKMGGGGASTADTPRKAVLPRTGSVSARVLATPRADPAIIGTDPQGNPIYDPRAPHFPEDKRFRPIGPGDTPANPPAGSNAPWRPLPMNPIRLPGAPSGSGGRYADEVPTNPVRIPTRPPPRGTIRDDLERARAITQPFVGPGGRLTMPLVRGSRA